jgi:hypothetical protein
MFSKKALDPEERESKPLEQHHAVPSHIISLATAMEGPH